MQRNMSIPNVYMQNSAPNAQQVRPVGGQIHFTQFRQNQKSIRPRDPSLLPCRDSRMHSRFGQTQQAIVSSHIPIENNRQYFTEPNLLVHRPIQPINNQHSIQFVNNNANNYRLINQQNLRSPNVNMNCTGLINLLSSSPLPSSSTSSSTCSSSASSLSTSASQSSTSYISSSFHTITCAASDAPGLVSSGSPGKSLAQPSLSELTDRLQMPPPSLPPPSVLRRLGKWSTSKQKLITTTTSLPLSPLSNSSTNKSELTNNIYLSDTGSGSCELDVKQYTGNLTCNDDFTI